MKRNQIEVYYVILMQLLLWAEVAVNNKRQSVVIIQFFRIIKRKNQIVEFI